MPPVVPVPEQPAVDDSYLSMNASQLRRKVKALIGLKNKNKKTIDDLKKERDVMTWSPKASMFLHMCSAVVAGARGAAVSVLALQ